MNHDVTIIGGGLAGSEAAWQAASAGLRVRLYEMRPDKMTPAHHTGELAELVCSNSLRANSLENAVGLLKEEMRRLNSIIMEWADRTRVPAGGALAVARDEFSAGISEALLNHPDVEIIRHEVPRIPEEGVVIIASGPLTSDSLAGAIAEFTGEEHLSFFDAAAPIVTLESVDMGKVFRASRYGKGEDDYLNCPMTEEEYDRFWEELCRAEKHAGQDFEKKCFFEGCLPVEEMARRGRETLLFGPLKPVGLTDPRTGRYPHAVVQLRQDNREGTLFNLVGFQTNLKWPEQLRVFRMISGLENADFARLGVMHRNTFINSPRVLEPTFQSKIRPTLFFAGQITGVEGYVESAASGLVAGLNATRLCRGHELLIFPPETAHGALAHYITTADPHHFQPMNVAFGLFPPLMDSRARKRDKKRLQSSRALDHLRRFAIDNGVPYVERE